MVRWIVGRLRSLCEWMWEHKKGIGWSALGSAIGAVLKWYYSIREARAKALKAEDERKKSKFETEELKRNASIRERDSAEQDIKARVEKAKRRMMDEQISKIPEESDEVNNEAMRQIQKEATKNKWRS